MPNETNETPKIKKTSAVTSVISEFKEFIARGNVIDLAVGIIIGSAFTAIVNSLVNDMLMPIMETIVAGINLSSITITIPFGDNPVIHIGSFFQAIVNFLIIAVCVFFMVKAINVFLKKKTDDKKPEPPKPSNEELLLTEIRDLLKENAQKD